MRIAQVVMRFGEFGPQLDRLGIGGGRFFEIAAVEPRDTKVVVGWALVGSSSIASCRRDDRIGEIAALALDFTQVRAEAGGLGGEFDCLFETGDAIAELPSRVKRHAEYRVCIRGLGLVLDDLPADRLRLLVAAVGVELARRPRVRSLRSSATFRFRSA